MTPGEYRARAAALLGELGDGVAATAAAVLYARRNVELERLYGPGQEAGAGDPPAGAASTGD